MSVNHPGASVDFGPEINFPLTIKRLPAMPAGATALLRYNTGGQWITVPVAQQGAEYRADLSVFDGDDVTFEIGYQQGTAAPNWYSGRQQKITVTAAGATPAAPVKPTAQPQNAASVTPKQSPNSAPNQPQPLFSPPNYSSPQPDTIARAVHAPLIAVLDSVRNRENSTGLDAAIDLLEDSLLEYAEDNSLPPDQRQFNAAIAAHLTYLLVNDPNVPVAVKKQLNKGKAPTSLEDLRTRIEEGKDTFRTKVLTYVKANAGAQKFFGLKATSRPNSAAPFSNPQYNKLFDSECSRFDYGILATNLPSMMRAVSELPPRKTELQHQRAQLSRSIINRLNPEQSEKVKKWSSRLVDMGVQGIGFGALALGSYGFGAAALLGVPAMKSVLGVTTKDIQTAVREGRPWDLFKLLATNNFLSRRFKSQTAVGEDLKDAGKEMLKNLIPFRPLAANVDATLEEKTDAETARKYILDACKKAAA